MMDMMVEYNGQPKQSLQYVVMERNGHAVLGKKIGSSTCDWIGSQGIKNIYMGVDVLLQNYS